eukprot:11031173-Karenia_brevis.AAC.1
MLVNWMMIPIWPSQVMSLMLQHDVAYVEANNVTSKTAVAWKPSVEVINAVITGDDKPMEAEAQKINHATDNQCEKAPGYFASSAAETVQLCQLRHDPYMALAQEMSCGADDSDEKSKTEVAHQTHVGGLENLDQSKLQPLETVAEYGDLGDDSLASFFGILDEKSSEKSADPYMADISERTLGSMSTDTGGDTKEESFPTHDDSRASNLPERARLSQLVRTSYTTAFSGIDAPGVALGVLTGCLQDRLLNRSVNKPRHLSGVEWIGNVRDELLHHPTSQSAFLKTSMTSCNQSSGARFSNSESKKEVT